MRELVKEIKMFFCLVTSVGQRNISDSPRGIEPQTNRFRNVDGVMFVEKYKRDGKFWARWRT